MDSTFKRKSSVAFFYNFPVNILDRRSRSASLLNGLRLFIDFISFTTKLSLFMFEACRLSVISPFFIRFKSSFRCNMIVVLKKWDSVQPWRADIELVMEAIPVLWLAASALTVCSTLKLMGFPEKGFVVLLILNIKSWYSRKVSGCVSSNVSKRLWYSLSSEHNLDNLKERTYW